MHDPDCEGACFNYSDMPTIFGVRTGAGPMRVAWDTNILIEFARHGRAMSNNVFSCPAGVSDDYCDELEALGVFMSVWERRDVRIVVGEPTRTDAKRVLSRERSELRNRQVDEIISALEHPDHEVRYDEARAAAIDLLPGLKQLERLSELDRRIVREALRQDAHVLMTLDQEVLDAASDAQKIGIAVLKPTEWVDTLAEADELGFASCSHGIIPDTHKLVHLYAAFESA